MGSLKKTILILITLFALFSGRGVLAQTQEERYEAVVTQILEEKQVEVQITDGVIKGKKVIAQPGGMGAANDNQKLKVADKIIVDHVKNVDGSDQYYVTDFVRRDALFLLATAFFLAIIIVGGLKGLGAFVGLIISFVVLLKYIIPQITAGGDSVSAAVTGSFVILFATLYLAHGVSRRTTAAVLGTFLSLIITAILASIFVDLARLTGFSSEEASYLSMFPGMQINLRGVLLGGMIIGALGVLDDITISQAACIFELKEANKNLSFKELYVRGLRIGKEHIASLVNTLVLAYAGISLPLLLLFTLNGGEPVNMLLNREMIATEIVRTLVGSLGLVAAVPITTIIAASLVRKSKI